MPRKPFVPNAFETAILSMLPQRATVMADALVKDFPPEGGLVMERYVERHVRKLLRAGLVRPQREGKCSFWHKTG